MACLESAVLEIPVISTACCAAEELIEEQNFGMVCENSEKGLYEMLTGVLEDRTCLDRFRKAPGENDVNRMPEEQLKELVLLIQRDF